jgi:outer membrane murein-binding lipoprotein Lpp
MKKVLLGSLLAGGLLFAAKNNDVTTDRVSSNERIALESQSPRVHPARMHKHQKANRRMDQVASDKHTINAYIPQGK